MCGACARVGTAVCERVLTIYSISCSLVVKALIFQVNFNLFISLGRINCIGCNVYDTPHTHSLTIYPYISGHGPEKITEYH